MQFERIGGFQIFLSVLWQFWPVWLALLIIIGASLVYRKRLGLYGDLFTTGNDRDNRAAVRAVPTDDLDLVGLAVYGPRNAVDKVLKGARMHP